MSLPFDFLDHPGPIAFAHRGGDLDGLENSMAAFEHAVSLGYRYLETDVHATADGVLLAFHDATLDRVTDRTGAIAQMPYKEVAKARIGGKEPIPLLEEVLGAWPQARVNIDVKAVPAIGPLAEVLHRAQAWDRVCVASFSERRLSQARVRMRLLAGREICTALGPLRLAALRGRAAGLRPLRRLVPPEIPCAQVPYSVGGRPFVTPGFVETAHSLGIQVHVWTVNDPAWMSKLLDLGVDGIITDNVRGLRETLLSRDMWHPA